MTDAYPGSNASLAEIIALADEYADAARRLMTPGGEGLARVKAPGRLCAVHAIELYLNAFLLTHGETRQAVRSRFHDLGNRAAAAESHGLVLRRLTKAHLTKLTIDREYLVTRYGPELAGALSERTRLLATLNEVAKKVRARAPAPTVGETSPTVPAAPTLAASNSRLSM